MKNRKIFAFALLVVLLSLFLGCSERAPEVNTDIYVPGFLKGDLYLEIGGVRYTCDVDVNDLIANFGDDYQFSEALSCAYDGMDKTFIYDTLELYTYPKVEGDFVSEIYAVDDVISSKGIEIGSGKDLVKAMYGEPTEDTGYLMIYEIAPSNDQSEGAQLYFTIEDEAVVAMAVTAEQLIE